MSGTIGRDATVTMNGVRLDGLKSFTFPVGSLRFEGATKIDDRNVSLHFTAEWDSRTSEEIELERRLEAIKRAILARRERKRWRRWQRQKRKQ